MTARSTEHASFAIERVYDAPVARIFAAWADPAAKTTWFGGPKEGDAIYELDFRVGGREHSSGGTPDGTVYTYDALYHDIAPEQRIVYTYEMTMGGQRISVSVASVELAAEGDGTRLTLTEHGVFLDGLDSPALREEGTGYLLDGLGAVLRGETPVGW
jgi:uncharacterized protein YndB with AHSA1/START domain